MNVEITVENTGTLTFDMTTDQITKMLEKAFSTNTQQETENHNITQQETENHNITLKTSESELSCDNIVASMDTYRKPDVIPQSKVNRMFGSDWRNNIKPEYNNSNTNGYKGFLLIECPSCGKRKAFCTKTPIRKSFCSCGHEIELYDLKKAVLSCKCGKTWRYMTNIKAQSFMQNCLACGSPIDVIYNPRRGNFETLWGK